jgi:hypothetical protein
VSVLDTALLIVVTGASSVEPVAWIHLDLFFDFEPVV